MYCKKCGNELESTAKFCSRCGTRIEEEQTVLLTEDKTAATVSYVPNMNTSFNNMSLKEFYMRFASKQSKGWVTAMVVVCFLSAAVSCVPLFLGNILSLLDIAVYAAMGALLLVTRKSVFALVPTIYSGLASVLTLAGGGAMTGVFALIAGTMSTLALKKIEKAYQSSQNDGVLPNGEI